MFIICFQRYFYDGEGSYRTIGYPKRGASSSISR